MISMTSPNKWEEFLKTAGERADFCQTSRWAEITGRLNQADSYYVYVTDKNSGNIVAGALVSLHDKVSALKGFASRIKQLFFAKRYRRLECLYGPVLLSGNEDKLDEVLEEIDNLAKDQSVGKVIFYGSAFIPYETIDHYFSRHGFRKKWWQTALLNLGDVDKHYPASSFKRSIRKAVRKCEKNNIHIRICDNADVLDKYFLEPYQRFADRKLSINARQMWALHHPHYTFFSALDSDQEVLGTLGTYSFNGLVREVMSQKRPGEKLPVQDFLHVEAFRYHKQKKDRMFDLAGFAPVPQTPKEKGIREFKQKWDGQLRDLPVYEKGGTYV